MQQVNEMRTILEEYHYLLEHDNIDCSQHMKGEAFLFSCWKKRYGFPLVTFILFVAGAYLYLLKELRNLQKSKSFRDD